MSTKFEVAKYNGKWAVFDKVSRTYTYIGKGRKFCENKSSELNNVTKN